MNIHIIYVAPKVQGKKKKIVSNWLYANEFVLGFRNCSGKNNFASGVYAAVPGSTSLSQYFFSEDHSNVTNVYKVYDRSIKKKHPDLRLVSRSVRLMNNANGLSRQLSLSTVR